MVARQENVRMRASGGPFVCLCVFLSRMSMMKVNWRESVMLKRNIPYVLCEYVMVRVFGYINLNVSKGGIINPYLC